MTAAAAVAAAVVSTTTTTTAAAAAAYRYTYILGRSLYVPLTSRCNSVPLPTTRGPGFVLPSSVASALINVRDAEAAYDGMPPPSPDGGGLRLLHHRDHFFRGNDDNDDDDDDDVRVHLPPYDVPLVTGLYGHLHPDHRDDIPGCLRMRRRRIADIVEDGGGGYAIVSDDGLLPSISTLVGEVRTRLDDDARSSMMTTTTTTTTTGTFDQVVIAGEGEPTLRMDALLAIARAVRDHGRGDRGVGVGGGASCDDDDDRPGEGRDIPAAADVDCDASVADATCSHPSSSSSSSSSSPPSPHPHRGIRRRRRQERGPAVRVITNGLCYGVSNLGYSPYNVERYGYVLPVHRHAILRDMIDAGVSRMSVALNTANRHEYDVLMEPRCTMMGGVGMVDPEGGGGGGHMLKPGTAHDMVCELIVEASRVGMDVEITGIDRPGIDKAETERLARFLMSARRGGGGGQRRSPVRWRRYFE